MKVLITGANGKTGSRVEAKLQGAGIETFGVSRSTQPSFDWNAPEGWSSVLQGIDAAYLTYHPDLSVPEAAGHIQEFTRLAAEAGVKHIVLLSGRGEEGAARAEEKLIDSDISWNIVKASWFAQNFSEDFMLDQIIERQLVVPEGTAREPFIDIDDIADVVVATILEPGLHNRLFEVTGPECLSFADCAEMISAAVGQPVTLLELPMPEYLEGLRQQGLPEHLVTLLQGLFGDLFDGRNAYTAGGVREALGREPGSFRHFAEKTVATGIWNESSQQQVQQESAS